MPSRHIWATSLLMAAALAWALGLFVAPAPWAAAPASVVGAGVAVTVAISVAGILIQASRLAYWLGIGALGLMLLLAAIRPLGPSWVAALALTGLAGVMMADRRLGGAIRLEPATAPVPDTALALIMLLLGGPVVTALFLTGSRSGAIVWLSLASWGLLYCYVRRVPFGLEIVRLGLPLLVATGLVLALPGRVAWAVTIGAAAVLSWTRGARLAVRPLIEQGSRVSIPPELLPGDVRRAAGIEDELR